MTCPHQNTSFNTELAVRVEIFFEGHENKIIREKETFNFISYFLDIESK